MRLQSGLYESALAVAITEAGDIAGLEVLLQVGAEANMQLNFGNYGSALAAAAAATITYRGAKEKIVALLANGADPNMQI
ncbi:hypothetical protein WAI453_007457 [Rhynchosporium graminicola]